MRVNGVLFFLFINEIIRAVLTRLKNAYQYAEPNA